MRPYDAATDFDGMFAIAREIVALAPFEAARRELLEYPRKEACALVETTAEGAIIGYCAASHPYWNDVAILDYLVVAPGHRRRRIGERLVRAVEEGVRQAGMRRICVQTISWNSDGIRFYERLGYVRRADLVGYFGDTHAMVWLDRALTGA